MKTLRLLFLAITFPLSTLYAQPLFENLYRFAPGNAMSFIAIAPTQNGGYYAIGGNPFDNTTIVFKIDSMGDILWNKKYSGSAGPVILRNIVSMPDGGFAAGGTSGNFFLMRGDSLGNTIWAWEYDYFLFEESVSTLMRTPDNGFMLSFNYYHESQPVLARIDSSGNVVFCKELRENLNGSTIFNIQMAADSNYFAMMLSSNPKTRVMKFDINGNEIWTIGIGDTAVGSTVMGGNTIAATPDGGCLLGGCLMNIQDHIQSLSISKITSQGNIEWIRAHPWASNQIDQATSVANTYDNGFIIASILADTLLLSHMETQLTRTDSDGHFLWTKKYPINNAALSKVIERRDHGFIFAGNIFISDWNFLIANIDSSGDLSCGGTDISQIDSSVTWPVFSPLYTVFSHTLDRDSINLAVDSGMMALDFCQLISVTEISEAQSITLYPNPFSTDAAFSTEQNVKDAVLKIYNSVGSLIRQEKISNLSSYILHRDGLPDGLYFFQLSTLPTPSEGQAFNSQLTDSGKFIVE